MPLDYRRFNGPDDSTSYKRFTKEYTKSFDELRDELLDKNGKRKDGRALDQARSLCMFCMCFEVKGTNLLFVYWKKYEYLTLFTFQLRERTW